MGRAAALAGLHRVAAGPRRGGRRRLPHSRRGREDETPPDTSRPDSIGGTGGPCARGSGEAARSVLWSGDTAPRFGATARAALSSLRRARNTSKPARPAALSAARTMITITSKWSSSATAAATAGPSSATASRIPTSSPGPLPPPWVWAPSGIPMAGLLLVAGGCPLPLTDAPGGAMDGAGAAALGALEPRQRGQTGRWRPRWMCPVPLHLGQGPNGRQYRNAIRRAMTARTARARLTVTAAHPSPQLAAPPA
jgi:hypothetical protein